MRLQHAEHATAVRHQSGTAKQPKNGLLRAGCTGAAGRAIQQAGCCHTCPTSMKNVIAAGHEDFHLLLSIELPLMLLLCSCCHDGVH
jgi:hypothetical protein